VAGDEVTLAGADVVVSTGAGVFAGGRGGILAAGTVSVLGCGVSDPDTLPASSSGLGINVNGPRPARDGSAAGPTV